MHACKAKPHVNWLEDGEVGCNRWSRECKFTLLMAGQILKYSAVVSAKVDAVPVQSVETLWG